VYDVIIVGAGPGGATLARLLGPGARVLLLERRRAGPAGLLPAKPCGGLLAPDAQRALSALGLGVPREVLAGPQLFQVRAVDAPSGLERRYPRSYLNVDRARLDAWLLELVPPGVEVRTGCRLRALRTGPGHVEVVFEREGGLSTARAGLLVGADGALSRVRRDAFPRAPEAPAWLALQEVRDVSGADPWYTAVFDPAITGFYGWTIPKDGRLVVGAALPTGGDAPARFAALLARLAALGVALGRPLHREGTLVRRPLRARHLVLGGGRVALLGEAAGLVSPSSAEGISFALRSAAALARALEPGLPGWRERYGAATRPLRAHLLLNRLKVPLMYRPWARRLLLASGLRAGPPPARAGR
jgi:flavin-dependent dehydrogenase